MRGSRPSQVRHVGIHHIRSRLWLFFASVPLQVLYLSPPLEHARAAWIHQFHAYLHTVAGLPRLRSKSFAVLGAGEGSSDYQRVIKALPRDSLIRAYQEIEARLAEVRSNILKFIVVIKAVVFVVHGGSTKLGS